MKFVYRCEILPRGDDWGAYGEIQVPDIDSEGKAIIHKILEKFMFRNVLLFYIWDYKAED